MKLTLKKETLGDLSPAELDAIAGGTTTLQSCNPVVCVRTLDGCVDTLDGCIRTLDGCVRTVETCIRTIQDSICIC